MARITMTSAQALALGILALQDTKDDMKTDAREVALAVSVLRTLKDQAKEKRRLQLQLQSH